MDYVGHLTGAGLDRPQADAVVSVMDAKQQPIIKELSEIKGEVKAIHAKLNMLIGMFGALSGAYISLVIYLLNTGSGGSP